MSKVAIVTDSTAYLPEQLVRELPIRVAPLQLIWDNETFRDGVDVQPNDFYTRLATSRTMPSTSQTTPMEFKEIYESLADQGYDILSVHISSKLSGTFDSAIQAKQMMVGKANVELVDSLSAGMALGFNALMAARAAASGASLQECKAIAEKAVPLTGVLFLVNTLEFLHRGGRIGSAQAFIGKLLDVKPILGLHEGKIEAMDKARTRNKAIERTIDLLVERIGANRPIRLATLHANAEEGAADMLERIKSRYPNGQIVESYLAPVSPVIGTHIGPGALGITWLAGM